MDISERLSKSITWLRFPLIFLIILLHCYSVQSLSGDHKTYFRVAYPFYNWLGETGVPGFFFISGYLFFHSKKRYFQKLSARFHTLFVPYLLWNTILLILYVLVYVIGIPQNINGRSLADYGILDYFRLYWDRGSYDNGNFVPLLCPLWYVRNLLIMSLISPLFYNIIKYLRELFILLAIIWWLMTNHNAFIPQTILFFSMGSFFSILDINPLQFVYNRKNTFLFFFLFFAFCDIVSHTMYGIPINLQIHRISLIFNIPVLFLLADYSVRNNFIDAMLPNAAFIVFCVHYPIVVLLRKICFDFFSNAVDMIQILLYFLCVILSTLVSIAIYLFLDNFFPNIKRILSGNR